jgi:predicted O-methyltransferase YrrM
MRERVFTADFVTANAPAWRELLADLVDKPNALMAEIGSYEGRSACWFVENVLTGPGARLHCFDPWAWPGALERFDANTDELQLAGRLVRVQGTARVLAGADELYDAIYIDGDHASDSVASDAELCWPRLKPGGVVLFDDYDTGHPGVPAAVDEFVQRRRAELEVLFRGAQLYARKAGGPVAPRLPVCSMHAVIHVGGIVCG